MQTTDIVRFSMFDASADGGRNILLWESSGFHISLDWYCEWCYIISTAGWGAMAAHTCTPSLTVQRRRRVHRLMGGWARWAKSSWAKMGIAGRDGEHTGCARQDHPVRLTNRRGRSHILLAFSHFRYFSLGEGSITPVTETFC